ncbi:hypothetical protein RhiXN_00842 [Rhizoctonia solani]|uniref:Uncharacterized protein n=1 Tax=Rhizoctonia solani TaxID=456999 RepID=A0A8H8SUZ1_9AGAM|nr:uncharacterized protein RhiXN_00842 [Rhizoctonia solani]QRW19436.1 hypothetical protein RhiXN_00842 [Rhizoctonia solani]
MSYLQPMPYLKGDKVFAKYLSAEPQTYQQLLSDDIWVANAVGSNVGTVVDMKEVNGHWMYSVKLKDGSIMPNVSERYKCIMHKTPDNYHALVCSGFTNLDP